MNLGVRSYPPYPNHICKNTSHNSCHDKKTVRYLALIIYRTSSYIHINMMQALNPSFENLGCRVCEQAWNDPALKVAGGVLHGLLCMYTGFYACTLIPLHVHWFLCMYTSFYACTLISIHVHWFLCMYTVFYACTLVSMHVHWFLCM